LTTLEVQYALNLKNVQLNGYYLSIAKLFIKLIVRKNLQIGDENNIFKTIK